MCRDQKFVDLLHDGAENLIELKRTCERFAELVKRGDFARLARVCEAPRITASLYSAKIVGVCQLKYLELRLMGAANTVCAGAILL